MNGVSGINNYRNKVEYGKFASGKRINAAKDDAAGLAIAQKILSEENGLNTGSRNIKTGISALNVADGAMSGMTDYLQSIRELSIQAMNGLYSDSDRQAIQNEINGYLDGINQMAKNTQFNTKNLLNGSMADMNIAANANGSGMKIRMVDGTLGALGIEGYSVMGGKIDLDAIDSAISKVTEARSKLGASTNGLEHAFNYNANAALQQTASRSRIEDLDYPAAISEQKKNKTLQDYRLMMQRKRMEQDGSVVRLL